MKEYEEEITNRDRIKEIINHYGIMKQLKYLHTEYFELDQAIIDYENLKDFNISDKKYLKNHIKEEVADVLLMIDQFITYYDLDFDEISEIMEYKMNRQLERIASEQEGDN
jgi:NTP pyrophosphatase (non-canonical NTP hydrolase)